MDKQAKLDKLQARWVNKCDCSLKDEAQAVSGYGSAYSDLVLIGEAPGKQEDKKGKPFVGAAGKFLDEMLETIKLNREDVYITNIVKFRPPNNRDPKPDEIKSCQNWLLDELELIQPKIIIFLGRHSMNHFFPDLKIGQAHGKIIKKKFKKIQTNHFLPLYHPAAALYNGKMRETLIDDFKKIPKLLEKIDKNQI